MFHDGSLDIICADRCYNLVQMLGRLILCHVRTVFISLGSSAMRLGVEPWTWELNKLCADSHLFLCISSQ